MEMRVVEECLISATPSLLPNKSPLTYLDYPWLLFPPMQPLFFYKLPMLDDFSSHILPTLKTSLSSALHYFSPFAANLAASPANPHNLFFLTDAQSSVTLTVAHSHSDFDNLCTYLPRPAHSFRQLVPSLPPISSPPNTPTPLLAIQITYFPPNSGFSIGLTYHPVLCDQRTFCNFLHSWASFSKYGHLPRGLLPPTFDRSLILDPNALRPILLGQLLSFRSKTVNMQPTTGLFRATFVMSTTDIQNAKAWIMAQCDKQNRHYPVLLSPYIVACAFVWPSLLRAQLQNSLDLARGPMYFGFIAGGITRLNYPVPVNYFGNCVGFGRAVAKREELLKEDGILTAADAVAMTIKALDTDILGAAEKWISDWEPVIGSEQHMSVVGSPKVNLYRTDFGWGRPEKVEEISIDVMRGVSLTESKNTKKGGMEIGLALTSSQMEAFRCIFSRGLRIFSNGTTF